MRLFSWFLAIAIPSGAAQFPAPALDLPAQSTQTAVLAGGCFWGVEAVFENVKGVSNVVSGYAGAVRTRPIMRWSGPDEPGTPNRCRSLMIHRRSHTDVCCKFTFRWHTIRPN